MKLRHTQVWCGAVSALAVMLAGTSVARAANISLTVASGDWNTAASWSSTTVPGTSVNGAADTANINNGGAATLGAVAPTIYQFTLANTTVGTLNSYIQTAGSLTVTDRIFASRKDGSNSLIEIRGGTLSVGGLVAVAGSTISDFAATFRVVGSAATVGIGGFRVDTKDSVNGGDAQFHADFVLDNSAGHISTVSMSDGSNNRDGTLDVGLHGGVLLSGGNSFTLITTGNANLKGAFAATPGHLWTTAGASGNVKDVTVTLDQNGQGTLDALTVAGLSFTGTNYGYVDLTNVSGSALALGVDVTGGTLSKLTDALTDAGVSWSAGSGAYDLVLNLNPAVSGNKYFAWDLSRIDQDMQVQALAVVPEPTTVSMILAGAVVALLRRRNKAI